MWAQTILGPFTCGRIDVDHRAGPIWRRGQVLLRVLAAGICGSDLPAFRNGELAALPHGPAPAPGFPLHEVVGGSSSAGTRRCRSARTSSAGPPRATPPPSTPIVDGSGSWPTTRRYSPAEAIVLQPLACVDERPVTRFGMTPAGRSCCGAWGLAHRPAVGRRSTAGWALHWVSTVSALAWRWRR